MIEISNLAKISLSKKFLRRVTEKVLKEELAEWRNENTYLSIALVGQKRIRELNKKYRRKDRITDVLAFGENLKSRSQELGEIVICPLVVKKNARRFRVTFKEELARVLVHGTLHILGYDHERSEKDDKKMEKKQEYYISRIKF